MQHSHFRGHPIIWVNDSTWVYEDTGEPLPGWGGEARPCAHCGKDFKHSFDVDPCLGILPGVKQACCGHGVPEEAYIIFENGVIVEGFTVEQKFDEEPLKGNDNEHGCN